MRLFNLFITNAYAQSEGLRDIKGPVDFPVNNLLLVLVVIVAAILMFALFKLKVKPQRKERPPEPVDTRTADEIAMAQLDELQSGSLLSEGKYKEYYSRLSGIIREYFENRFEVRAPEMTTEEFLWSLDESKHLTADQNAVMREFLNSCDIVKFAKHIPGIEDGKASMELARKLVVETRQAPTTTVSDKVA